MRALITGSNGTIGRELKRYLEYKGVEVYSWDREHISISEYQVMEDYIQKLNPDIIYHLAIASQLTGMDNETWRVNYEWPSELAWICRIHQIKFVFTSTFEVFSDYSIGPFDLNTKPDAFEGFGFEKRMAEERVLYQNPQSIVIRLPWQIANDSDSNTLIAHIESEMEEYGRIIASTNFYPCCAFLEDTVQEIYRIATDFEQGRFMIDANKGTNYYEIVKKLSKLYNKNWKIVKSQDYDYNQCMQDDRCILESIDETIEQKIYEIEQKSKKKLAILGRDRLFNLVEAYEKLGYTIDTIVDEDIHEISTFCSSKSIKNYGDDLDLLEATNQIIVTDDRYLNYEFIKRFKDKHIILNKLPYIDSIETYEKYKSLFRENSIFIFYEFNQLITMRKIYEQLKDDNLGKITNIFIDIGIDQDGDIKENFQDIIMKPLSFINLYFNRFRLDYSDYNERFQSVFTHHCNGSQRMNTNFFKLWYPGIKIILRFIGEKGELRVEGKYTDSDNWSFKPIQVNEIETGQGEFSNNDEISTLALKEYIKKMEEVIHKEFLHKDVYSASEALNLYSIFNNIWDNHC